MLEMFKLVTLLCFLLHLTPIQLQCGVGLDQFRAMMLSGSWETESFKASSDDSSVLLLGIAMEAEIT